MEFSQLVQQALQVKQAYRQKNQQDGHRLWEAAEYLQGLMGDVGDLAKLIMAKNKFRHKDDVDENIAHELADCLWSVMVLADELGVNLEVAFTQTMVELHKKLDAESSSA